MTRAYQWLREFFVVDLRSLALLRIGLGVSVLADTVMRAGNLVELYTEAGVLPGDLLADMDGAGVALSIHYWAGVSPWLQGAVFALTAACALALIVGWRTRIVLVACWYLVSSVQIRQPLVYFGGDSILRLLLFWSCFLPLGARFSVDQVQGREEVRSDRFVSGATVALLLQVCLIYWATAARKTGPLWWSGDALFYALHRELWVTSFGVWLRGQPALVTSLNWATLAIEWLGPCLAFVPVFTPMFRLATVVMFWSFHLGLAAAMSIGLFPLFSMVAWLPFIPGVVWTWGGVPERALPERRRGWASRVASLTALVLLVYVVVLLAQRARVFPRVIPAQMELVGKALRIQQTWNMFAPDPPRASTVWELRRTLRDGSVALEPAASSFRWTTYLVAVSNLPEENQSLRRFAMLRCQDRPESTSLQVLAHRRPTLPEGPGAAFTTTTLEVTCDVP